MKILIFTEGTIIMHKSALGLLREEIVRQAMENKPIVKNFAEYVPTGNAVEKIKKWKEQGGEIIYFSSRRTPEQLADIRLVLKKYNFPAGELEYRKGGETYKDAGERIVPDILIEDDCETIGGEKEMISPHLKPEVKNKVKSIVVKEFGGIDHLSDDAAELFR
ncbi:MAG: hypothetical protein AAB756_01130 [Patescibacteria group bacterium]